MGTSPVAGRPGQTTSARWGLRLAIGSVVVLGVLACIVFGRSNTRDPEQQDDAADEAAATEATRGAPASGTPATPEPTEPARTDEHIEQAAALDGGSPSVAPSVAAPAVVATDAGPGLQDAGGAAYSDTPANANVALTDIVAGVRAQIARAHARALAANAPPDVMAGVARMALVGALPPALDRIAASAGPDWPAQIDRYLRERSDFVGDASGDPSNDIEDLRRRTFSPENLERANAVEQMVEAIDD